MSICINGIQFAAGNSLNMLAFKSIFLTHRIREHFANYNNIKSVYITNENIPLFMEYFLMSLLIFSYIYVCSNF